MMKPTGKQVAQSAVDLFYENHAYGEMDCQAFVEAAVARAGGQMNYAGSNDMARNAVCWMGTIENAKAAGKLVPGAGVMIHSDDESGLPAKYRGDGLGDFSHVGLYIGDDLAVTDKPKGSLLPKKCEVIHSSQSMGRVAGTTIKNGWTHVVWFKEIDYGESAAAGVTLGAGIAEDEAFEGENPSQIESATVHADNGKPVKLRAKPSTQCGQYWLRDVGTTVDVLAWGDTWCKVRSRSRVGYMMTKFLRFGGEADA